MPYSRFGRSTTGAVPRETTLAGFAGIHPSDYTALRDAGKTAADLTKGQRLISQGRNFLRTTKRDVVAQVHAHKLRTNKDRLEKMLRHQKDAKTARERIAFHIAQGGKNPKSSRVVTDTMAAAKASERIAGDIGQRVGDWKNNQKIFSKRSALVLGGTVLGTAVALKGFQEYRKWRKKAKETTQYRNIDVYPEHDYAAVGQQVHNQPYYNPTGYYESIIEHVHAFKTNKKYLF